MVLRKVKEFFQLQSASGIVLLVATVLALICMNSEVRPAYEHFLHLPVSLDVGSFSLEKSVSHWINDGLMVIFFLLVGLEIKREMLVGQLSNRAQVLLPAGAAAGGMLVPALIYLAFNRANPAAANGWAIPSATDIAFSLGVLAVLGRKAPTPLRVFLTALAVLDDLGAILIIAIFYTTHLDFLLLCGAFGVLGLLYGLNRAGARSLLLYLLLGIPLWLLVLLSGVHATVAGVLLALTIPLNGEEGSSPLERLEHALNPWVAFGIMPLFAFANAGLDLSALSLSRVLSPLPLGIALGLFLGKQLGVLAASWALVRLRLSRLPMGSTWLQFYGTALLTGIGFTMSLFIGALAFPDPAAMTDVQIGVIVGSLLSAISGYVVLIAAAPRRGP